MFIQFNPQENERVEAMEEPRNENVSKHNETSEDKLNKQKTEIAANKLARYRDVSNIRHWLFMAIKWIISLSFGLLFILVYIYPVIYVVAHTCEICQLPLGVAYEVLKNKWLWVGIAVYMSFPLCVLTAALKYSHIEEVAKSKRDITDIDVGGVITRAAEIISSKGMNR